ncbi:hypothetical protein B0H66DRAFT_608361 [Apodospora peruviana]|uniref:Uncharacterized protein n=1 Tax=Apodospora peruviana TaxID=516989 RepID=A0AAE0LY60_9PEZI|nr:hypothetical protein B0H66DRAFT_608361 [Apodospora peruviana]
MRFRISLFETALGSFRAGTAAYENFTEVVTAIATSLNTTVENLSEIATSVKATAATWLPLGTFILGLLTLALAILNFLVGNAAKNKIMTESWKDT